MGIVSAATARVEGLAKSVADIGRRGAAAAIRGAEVSARGAGLGLGAFAGSAVGSFAKAQASTTGLSESAPGQRPRPKLPEGLGAWEPEDWYNQLPQNEHTPGPLNRLGFDSLRMMSRTPFISPIIHEIERQVSLFARRQPTREATGFDIALTDDEAKPRGAQKKRIAELIDFTERCGAWTPEQMMSRRRMPFVRFLRLTATNLALYDGAPIEIGGSALGRGTGTGLENVGSRVPASFQALAGNTIRMAVPKRDKTGAIADDPDAPASAQVWQNRLWRQWTSRHMAYVSLRPRLDFESHGYGWPPLEELVDVITYLLWGIQYNAMQFRQGLLGNGLMILKGSYPPEQWQQFKQYFQSLMTGVTNAHRIGYLNLPSKDDDFKFDTLGRQTNRDGEFMAFTRLLMQLSCAVYGIDPMAACGMLMGPEGQKQSLTNPSPDARTNISWAKSIPHILVEIEYALNIHVFHPMTDGEFSLRFRGLEEEMESARLKRQKEQLETTRTFDEIRAEDDLEPLGPERGGNLLGNTQWMQAYLAGRLDPDEQPEEQPEDENGHDDGAEGDVQEPSEQGPDRGRRRVAQTAEEALSALGAGENAGEDEDRGLRRAAPVPSWTKGGLVRTYVFEPADDDGEGEDVA